MSYNFPLPSSVRMCLWMLVSVLPALISVRFTARRKTNVWMWPVSGCTEMRADGPGCIHQPRATCPSQPFGRKGQWLKYSIDKLDFKHLHNDIDQDNDGVSVLNFAIEMRLLTGDAYRDINNINVNLILILVCLMTFEWHHNVITITIEMYFIFVSLKHKIK